MKASTDQVRQKSVLFICYGLLILFSFFQYSNQYSPWLNADAAVEILMTHFYQGEFYFWGQNRGGALIPCLAHALHRISGLSASWAVCIVQYVILILGFLSFASFLKSHKLKFLLCLAWFLPPFRFVDFMWNFFGPQINLLAISLYCLKQSDRTFILYYVALSLQCLALWVSDFSILGTICFLYIVAPLLPQKKYWIPTLLAIAFSMLFLSHARSLAVSHSTYDQFPINTISECLDGLMIVAYTIKRMLFFEDGNMAESLYAYTGIVFIAFFVRKITVASEPMKDLWYIALLLHVVLVFIGLFAANWVYENHMARRYFTVLFYALLLFATYALDRQPPKIELIWLLSLWIVLGSCSGLYPRYIPANKPPKMKMVKALDQLAPAGIIAEYWNSYVNSVHNPAGILTTPHDQDAVRSSDMVDRVFQQSNIYLIKDGWLDHFPDSIVQFDRTLIKDGQSFYLADSYLCKFRVK